MVPGHTHADVDRLFSPLSKLHSECSWNTPMEFLSLITERFKEKVVNTFYIYL